MIERGSSVAWVAGVVDMFAAEGLDVRALFAEARLDIRHLDDPDERFSADDVSRLWALAVVRSGNDALGLSKDLAARHGNFGLVGYAMMACPTLRHGLEKLAAYMDLVSNAATFSLTASDGGQWLELGHVGAGQPVPRQRFEFGMLTVLTYCSWITGRECRAKTIEFVSPDPVDATPYENAFGCPVHFGQRANRALLADTDLALPLLARSAPMAELHQRLVEEDLERLEPARTGVRVRKAIAARLACGAPRRQDIASALGVSDRTLQRRLQEEGTSFAHLCDATRRELAQQYLGKAQHSLSSVSDLLGFEDQSNFFRACRRWFGESPGQYRARLTPQGESVARH